MAFGVLFLCTGNSSRSILCEASLNHLGQGRFEAASAGSRPAGVVNPHALDQLRSRGMSVAGLHSKSWETVSTPDAQRFDLVITVCDNAAAEPCPVLFGDFVRTHWGLPDPASVEGTESEVADAFSITHRIIIARMRALTRLPVETMNPGELTAALQRIEDGFPALPLQALR
jgi:protein-tyrosine-phosphatase